jgi:hypothetical protein
MKNTIIAFLLFSVVGCAWLGEQVDYQKACLSDPACLESAKKDAELVKTVANAAFPGVGMIAGASVLALSLWFRGRKKKEQK